MIVYIEVQGYDPETGAITYEAWTPDRATLSYQWAAREWLRAAEQYKVAGQNREYRIWQNDQRIGYYPINWELARQIAVNHFHDAGLIVDLRD